ncbi:MAG: hypothetical protein R6V23_15285 [Bacteroidales bacterium]
MGKANIKNRIFKLVCTLTMLFLFSCVRMVPLQEGIIIPTNPLNKTNDKILVVMDKASSEKVITFKPGTFSDKFSLKAGKSIKSNILIFISSQFQEVDFANDFSEKNENYEYYLKIDWKDYKIDMGKSIFSDTKTNLYIDYYFMNSKKDILFTSVTDGSSVESLSEKAIATAINPFAFIATKKAEELIANSWNEALANSISEFSLKLNDYSK